MSFLLYLSLITLLRRKEIKYAYVVVCVSKKPTACFRHLQVRALPKGEKRRQIDKEKGKTILGGIGYPMQSSKNV
jgi:hypothetical protein